MKGLDNQFVQTCSAGLHRHLGLWQRRLAGIWAGFALMEFGAQGSGFRVLG